MGLSNSSYVLAALTVTGAKIALLPDSLNQSVDPPFVGTSRFAGRSARMPGIRAGKLLSKDH